jgi:hypothetical protein
MGSAAFLEPLIGTVPFSGPFPFRTMASMVILPFPHGRGRDRAARVGNGQGLLDERAEFGYQQSGRLHRPNQPSHDIRRRFPMRATPVFPLVALGSFLVLTTGCGEDSPVAAGTGTVSVLTDPDGEAIAAWRLVGPSGFDLSAEGDSTLAGLDAGNYAIEWSVAATAVAEWAAPDPASVTQTLAGGGTLTFVGAFSALTGDITIDATPDSIAAPWQLTGPRGFVRNDAGDAHLIGVPAGAYTLTWQDVVRWSLPDPGVSSQTVVSGETTAFPGEYAEIEDIHEPNDALNEEAFVGGPLRDPGTDGNIVLDVTSVFLDTDDDDFYGFTSFANVPIAVLVEPLAGFGFPVDARNLALRLWRRVDAGLGTWQLFAQIDFNAAGETEYHPPIPYAQAGYLAVEIYSNDSIDAIQPYRLRISNEALAP